MADTVRLLRCLKETSRLVLAFWVCACTRHAITGSQRGEGKHNEPWVPGEPRYQIPITLLFGAALCQGNAWHVTVAVTVATHQQGLKVFQGLRAHDVLQRCTHGILGVGEPQVGCKVPRAQSDAPPPVEEHEAEPRSCQQVAAGREPGEEGRQAGGCEA